MALQSPFFGKHDPDPATMRRSNTAIHPNAGANSNAPAPAQTSGASMALAPAVAQAASTGPSVREGGSKLTVGPNIKLKGVEITDCDTLVVEGMVEATMDSRLMQIAECGAFKGTAGIDIAEIYGRFDGELTVRDKLIVYATGKVTGKVRYGKLVVEEGGQLSGEVSFGGAAEVKSTLLRSPLQVA